MHYNSGMLAKIVNCSSKHKTFLIQYIIIVECWPKLSITPRDTRPFLFIDHFINSKPYLMSVIENNIEFISCLFNVLDFTKSFFVHDSLFKLLHGSFIALGLGPLVL